VLVLQSVKFVDGTADAIRGLNGLIEVHLPDCQLKVADVETILALPDLKKLKLPASFPEDQRALVTTAAKQYPNVKIFYE
jgi:hypothetical protein